MAPQSAAIPLALLIPAVRRDRMLTLLVGTVILSALPLPIAVGRHALADRFYYTPGLLLCLLAAAAIGRLVRSETMTLRTAGAALLASILSQSLPLPALCTDPFFEFIALAAEIILCILAARSGELPKSVAACALVIALSQQITFYTLQNLPGYAPLLVTVAVCTAIAWRRAWWLGGVLTLCALGIPDVSLGLFLAIYLPFNLRRGTADAPATPGQISPARR